MPLDMNVLKKAIEARTSQDGNRMSEGEEDFVRFSTSMKESFDDIKNVLESVLQSQEQNAKNISMLISQAEDQAKAQSTFKNSMDSKGEELDDKSLEDKTEKPKSMDPKENEEVEEPEEDDDLDEEEEEEDMDDDDESDDEEPKGKNKDDEDEFQKSLGGQSLSEHLKAQVNFFKNASEDIPDELLSLLGE